ncbi:MAG: hypothetical protein R3E10_16965 [Gemmatimonadota bacterium]
MNRRSGSMLVDVVLGLAVLEIALVVGWRAVAGTLDHLARASERAAGLSTAESLADSIVWFGLRGSGTVTGAWGRIDWSVQGPWADLQLFLPDPTATTPWARIEARVP